MESAATGQAQIEAVHPILETDAPNLHQRPRPPATDQTVPSWCSQAYPTAPAICHKYTEAVEFEGRLTMRSLSRHSIRQILLDTAHAVITARISRLCFPHQRQQNQYTGFILSQIRPYSTPTPGPNCELRPGQASSLVMERPGQKSGTKSICMEAKSVDPNDNAVIIKSD